MATQDQIDSFHQFASREIAAGRTSESVDVLYDEWRLQNQTSDERCENIAAIAASIEDMKNGKTGRDASMVATELRVELNLPASE